MIAVDRLTHDYGERRALDGVSFGVEKGEVFGLLGPNGGGKTTLFRIASTLMRATAGAVRIAGLDCAAEAASVRRRIGVVFQSPSLDRKLTVAENLRHQGHLYGLHGAALEDRSREMLERVKLADRAGERTENLSGGLRRRVELAKGLLHEPEVLLLDEPSTGLDPGARLDLWTYLRELGVTILLTTHLIEEAERCDRLAILDRGKLVALGTPDELKATVGGTVVTARCADPDGLAEEVGGRVVDGALRVETEDGNALVARLMALGVEEVTLKKPSLEDVFIQATGHRFFGES
ncbi:MAG: ABC transporter ATP-binding protein [Planctomycetota bacterium]